MKKIVTALVALGFATSFMTNFRRGAEDEGRMRESSHEVGCSNEDLLIGFD
jgi:hypothetical protein